jgi:hypothetical protein
MKSKAYVLWVVRDGHFVIVEHGSGFPDNLATKLWFDLPGIDGDTALAKFYASGLDRQCNVELTPMPGSPYTRATFERATVNGVTVIVGRYW